MCPSRPAKSKLLLASGFRLRCKRILSICLSFSYFFFPFFLFLSLFFFLYNTTGRSISVFRSLGRPSLQPLNTTVVVLWFPSLLGARPRCCRTPICHGEIQPPTTRTILTSVGLSQQTVITYDRRCFDSISRIHLSIHSFTLASQDSR